MTQTVLDRPDHTTGLTPTGVGVDHRGIERPRRSLRPPRIAIDWSSGPSATVLLLLLGMGLGPHGLAFLTPQILSFLDSAAPVAMAALGVIAGLSLGGPGSGRVAVATGLQAVVTAGAVGAGVFFAGPPLTGSALFSPLWMAAVVLAIVAATSSSLTKDRLTAAEDSDPVSLRDHDYLIPIVIGTGILAWLREPSAAAAVSLTLQAAMVSAVIAGAGWLLVSRAVTINEERLFTLASLLLLGGVADYLSVSALFSGLVAGVFLLLSGKTVRESIQRDVGYVQHSLLVLIFLLAGAHADFSQAALMLSMVYVVVRTVGKLIGGRMATWVSPGAPSDTGRRLISPGVFGVAFALNVMRVAGPEFAPVLTVAVVGTIASSVIAAAAGGKRSEP